VGHTGTVCWWRTASGRLRFAIDLEGAELRRVYRFAGAAAVAGVLSVSLADSNLAAGRTGQGVPSGVAWGRCSDPLLRQDGAQCGYVSVPLSYSDPTAARVRIAVSRIRHTGRDYQGVVLVNPGGPGEPGLDWGDYLRAALLGEGFAAAARDYDWIGFDTRGVGASRPALSCLPDYFSARRPEYVPRTKALLDAWLRRSAAYAHACETRSLVQAMLLRNMTTRDLALDMDGIRQALGQRQITYYGLSYGTYLGQVYATLFPSRVRRLILDSNVDPRTVWYRFGLRQDVPFNRDENLWFRWLARNHRVFDLGPSERAVSQLYYATEQRLLRQPAGGKIGPDEWADAFTEAGYSDQEWPVLGTAFSAWVHKHNRAAANQLIGLYRVEDAPGNDNSYATSLAVTCTDAPSPTQWSVWSRDNWALYRRAPLVTWQSAWLSAPCFYWPAPPSRPVRVDGSQIRSALLIDETLDGVTPFEGSLGVRRLFPHSVLLAEPGGTSHADPLRYDLCVDRTIAAYLATGKLPRRKPHAKWDKTCAPPPHPIAYIATPN
jgi:pimeloyl-ACP methyl ester carboxylesterase